MRRRSLVVAFALLFLVGCHGGRDGCRPAPGPDSPEGVICDGR